MGTEKVIMNCYNSQPIHVFKNVAEIIKYFNQHKLRQEFDLLKFKKAWIRCYFFSKLSCSIEPKYLNSLLCRYNKSYDDVFKHDYCVRRSCCFNERTRKYKLSKMGCLYYNDDPGKTKCD